MTMRFKGALEWVKVSRSLAKDSGSRDRMKPIVLIHGYSAESKESTAASIASIYGTLPKDLKATFGGRSVVEIDLGRYLSLEDGVRVDDISRAFDRALEEEYPH